MSQRRQDEPYETPAAIIPNELGQPMRGIGGSMLINTKYTPVVGRRRTKINLIKKTDLWILEGLLKKHASGSLSLLHKESLNMENYKIVCNKCNTFLNSFLQYKWLYVGIV